MAHGQPIANHFSNLKRAYANLEKVLNMPYDEIVRDSIIKRFELVFELLWKLIKKLAAEENLECYSPKSCFKIAYQMKLIEDEEIFLDMLEYRNLTVHTYDEYDAERVYQFVRGKGIFAFKKVIQNIEEKIK